MWKEKKKGENLNLEYFTSKGILDFVRFLTGGFRGGGSRKMASKNIQTRGIDSILIFLCNSNWNSTLENFLQLPHRKSAVANCTKSRLI
ncbi:MAG: hypothetical protein A2Y28_04515 [Chlamydiae bacterium GWC2_50_10]|nr:MAG: hypothetical protein A2Z85_02775 [Chlamydiae bacterium GWA2_50_15]OGN54020.1 MAG: hypothetical protein A2098_00350 [Chlamydiae bacterium GWF2_49_8]OGN54914.1 MAG: hypothetical protein A2Y28_04515 [Chlamydiae bacterium GWC2_50_10]OGN57222.1 MAG: hypothetical protein A3D18_00110 [Chlamydiae bacterium RIFCSPHIGHO2_02_FULL_49_29]OGN62858.1 MAG: hypothetical protein A3E26_01795 [Chlamydiae bacterium RIFCSPHIGHO2_12_FULL_49_32]OGN70052.1 MAG: hypothetical protein A3I15_02070 [Chlamydiae bact